MPNFNQDSMVVINYEEQIQQNPFAYSIHKLIDESIDLGHL